MKKFSKIYLLLGIIFILGFGSVYAGEFDNKIGISKVDKLLSNEDGAKYALIQDERVRVIDGDRWSYTIVDVQGHIFKADIEDISISNISRNGDNLLDKNTVLRNEVINSAFYKMDIPYVYGATGPVAYDCSGYTFQIYKRELGIDLNRVSRDQTKNGIEVLRDELLPGDLVFFAGNGVTISHVGIYIGNNEMIHASSGAGKVVVSSLESNWYKTKYVGARRLIY